MKICPRSGKKEKYDWERCTECGTELLMAGDDAESKRSKRMREKYAQYGNKSNRAQSNAPTTSNPTYSPDTLPKWVETASIWNPLVGFLFASAYLANGEEEKAWLTYRLAGKAIWIVILILFLLACFWPVIMDNLN